MLPVTPLLLRVLRCSRLLLPAVPLLRFSCDFPFVPGRCFWLLPVCCSRLLRSSGGLWVRGLLRLCVPLILWLLRCSLLLLSVAPLLPRSCGFSVAPCCGSCFGSRLFRCSVAPRCCSRPFRCACGCPVAPGCCPRSWLLLCSRGPLFRCSRLSAPVVSSVFPDTNNKKKRRTKNDAQKTEKKQKKNRKKTEKKQKKNKKKQEKTL